MERLLVFPDDVTAVDLLHADPLAQTIAEVIRAHPSRGLVLGVHGDWGAGKSTVLTLVQTAVNQHEGVATLWFNGWEYEGFEDAKIAILEGIVRHLQQDKKFHEKAKDLLRRLRKRIDYMKLMRATVVGGAGVMAAGPAGLALMLPMLVAPSQVGETFDKGAELFKEDEDRDDPLDLHGFRRDFSAMLDRAGIDQLIVLVDDLDRCLPKTAIGTLEAIRLLLCGSRTAFVLACDRAMIEYAVREHFPARPGMKGDEYARRYLDKLIQIPFVLPVLGPMEVGSYVQLLLLEGVLGAADRGFLEVLAQARILAKKPWIEQQLDLTPVKAAMAKDESLRELHTLMLGIAPVLAAGTDGNPRQIKRFINSVFVRRRAAEARGLGAEVKVAALMKLMLAEYFHPDLFDTIAGESRDGDGTSALIMQLEGEPALAVEKVPEPKRSPTKSTGDADSAAPLPNDYVNDPKINKWAALEPRLADTDLRPYLFVIRDARLVSSSRLPEELTDLLSTVANGKSLLARKPDVLKLTPEARGLLASELVTRLSQASDASRRDFFAKGIQDLLRLDGAVAGIVDRGFVTMSTTTAGTWVSNLSELVQSGPNFRAWLQQSIEQGAPRPVTSIIDAMLRARGG
jgi:hypothetical protein